MDRQQDKRLLQLVRISAIIIIWGALLSGPVGTGLAIVVKAQPPWQSIQTFAENYHRIQTVPFILGFILMMGSCLLVAAAARLTKEEIHKVMAMLALICITVYSAMITINYSVQIAYIPTAITTYQEFIPLLTMSNPSSLSWAIEMFGYMFQGAAFFLLFPVFISWKKSRPIKMLLFINLLMSIGGAVAASIDVAWAMKPFGIMMFIAWNLVLIILMWLIAAESKDKLCQSGNTV